MNKEVELDTYLLKKYKNLTKTYFDRNDMMDFLDYHIRKKKKTLKMVRK